ncbi:MAG TPA: hypothetical protein VJP05_08020 [Acidimicrobiia bacterium]|nr:hypothetical protein [Acidimicrobiia bacterium]
MNVAVARSPMRMLGYAALAVPAILLSVDMLFAHRWFPGPDATTQVVGSTVDEAGSIVDVTVEQLTVDGRAQHRRDVVVGYALLLGGIAAMGWSLKELVRPTVILRADRDGLSLRVDGPGHPPRLFPWEDVLEVRSSVLDDDGDPIAVLSVHLADRDLVPVDPAGGTADPPWLHLFADEWDTPAHQVAPLLDQMTRRVRPESGGK